MGKIEKAIVKIQKRINELKEDEQNWSWHSSDKTRVDELLMVIEMLNKINKNTNYESTKQMAK